MLDAQPQEIVVIPQGVRLRLKLFVGAVRCGAVRCGAVRCEATSAETTARSQNFAGGTLASAVQRLYTLRAKRAEYGSHVSHHGRAHVRHRRCTTRQCP